MLLNMTARIATSMAALTPPSKMGCACQASAKKTPVTTAMDAPPTNSSLTVHATTSRRSPVVSMGFVTRTEVPASVLVSFAKSTPATRVSFATTATYAPAIGARAILGIGTTGCATSARSVAAMNAAMPRAIRRMGRVTIQTSQMEPTAPVPCSSASAAAGAAKTVNA